MFVRLSLTIKGYLLTYLLTYHHLCCQLITPPPPRSSQCAAVYRTNSSAFRTSIKS